MSDVDVDWREWARENEDKIRREAKSDAPDAHIFAALADEIEDLKHE